MFHYRELHSANLYFSYFLIHIDLLAQNGLLMPNPLPGHGKSHGLAMASHGYAMARPCHGHGPTMGRATGPATAANTSPKNSPPKRAQHVIFGNFTNIKNMWDVRAIIFVAESRRDLCYSCMCQKAKVSVFYEQTEEAPGSSAEGLGLVREGRFASCDVAGNNGRLQNRRVFA